MSEQDEPGKSRAYWEDQVHIEVVQKGKESPAYEVKPERGSGRSRILHRHMLMACNTLPLEEPTTNIVQKQRRETRRRQTQDTETVEPFEDLESSDEDAYFWAHRHQQQQATEPAPQLDRQPDIHSEGMTFCNELLGQELGQY